MRSLKVIAFWLGDAFITILLVLALIPSVLAFSQVDLSAESRGYVLTIFVLVNALLFGWIVAGFTEEGPHFESDLRRSCVGPFSAVMLILNVMVSAVVFDKSKNTPLPLGFGFWSLFSPGLMFLFWYQPVRRFWTFSLRKRLRTA